LPIATLGIIVNAAEAAVVVLKKLLRDIVLPRELLLPELSFNISEKLKL
jgi:hypothetical protein